MKLERCSALRHVEHDFILGVVMKNEMSCPICKVEMRSDANIEGRCKLCGMGTGVAGKSLCSGCEMSFVSMSVRRYEEN